MSKFCPNCGKELPDDSNFCLECGYDFSRKTSKSGGLPSKSDDSNIFLNGKIFLVVIVIILIVGAILIFSSNGNDGGADDAKPTSGVDLTISDVKGYDGGSGSDKSYTYYVEVLFTKVPNNKDEYLIKTVYYDENNTEVGNTIESLSNVYYDTDFPISIGHYTAYKLVKVDNVKVQIIKDGKVLDEFSSKVDQNKIRW